MPNNVIPGDPSRVGLKVVDANDGTYLVVKVENLAGGEPDHRVICSCANRPDADAIVHWIREGLYAHTTKRSA